MTEVLRFIVVPLAVPIITAIIGAFSLMLKDYRKARNAEHRSKERLESTTLEVDFIRQWLQAKQLLGSLKDTDQATQEWLDACYESVKGNGLREAQSNRQPRAKMAILRRLLLIGHLHSPGALFYRALYWLSLLMLNLFATGGLIQIFAGVKGGVDLFLGSLLIFGVPAFLFAVLCRVAEKSYESSMRTPPPRW
jgi:hypothetical protein